MAQPNPFFTEHAHAYAVSRGHARGPDLARLVELTGAGPGVGALDVATGTGHTALALAAAGADVVGLDPTPAMLEEARRLAAASDADWGDRVRFVAGVAEALPFPDAAFDVVTCRRAAHHFTDLALAVREMGRVLRPGGRLGISDMCPEPVAAAGLNRLERLRDPTHVEALDEDAWQALVRDAGFRITAMELSVEDIPFDTWLSPVAPGGPEAAAIRAELATFAPDVAACLMPEPSTNLWRKRRLVLCAQRPS